MSRHFFPQISLVLAAGLLAGCAMETKPVATEPDIVSVRIAQAAERASKAVETISGIVQERAQTTPPEQDYTTVPPALMAPVTIKWTGPAEQILQTLAARAAMRFHRTGAAPAAPLLVNVDVYQEPLIDVLHSVGLQVGRRADVSVNGVNNSVEIRYAPADKL